MLDHVTIGRRWAVSIAAMLAAFGMLASARAATSGAADSDSNRAVARTEATRLLALIEVPPGVTSVQNEPAGDGGVLATPGLDSATPNLVDAWGWWTTALKPSALVTYFEKHLPAGARLEGSEKSSTGLEGETFSFGPIPGVLSERVISITAAPLAGGGTGVRTDGEAVWLTARPAWERIPSTVQSVTFTARGTTAFGRHRGRTSTPRTVTGEAARRIVALINGFEVVQPGARSCPIGRDEVVRMTFRSANGGVLASAVEHPTGCASVSLTVGGRAGPDLNDYPAVTSELIRTGAIPPCTGRQLQVTANPLARDQGGDVLTLTFTNRSDSMCRVTGFPRFRLIDRAGRRLRVSAHHLGSADVVPLDPGEAAWASVTSTRCGAPRAKTLSVALPGVPGTWFILSVGSGGKPFAPCHGRIDVGSLTPVL
jgi:hypothetical protein